MARRKSNQFYVRVRYALGWGDNHGYISTARGADTEESAMALAADEVAEMRQAGADAATREVTVRRSENWDNDRCKYRCPPLFSASYYDPEQRLTDSEAYAARVHDWHETSDWFNACVSRSNGRYRAGYQDWAAEWGPKPERCPACGSDFPGPYV